MSLFKNQLSIEFRRLVFKRVGILSRGIQKFHDNAIKNYMLLSCGLSNISIDILGTLNNLKKVNGKFRKLVTTFVATSELLKLAYFNIKFKFSNFLGQISDFPPSYFFKLAKVLYKGDFFISNLQLKASYHGNLSFANFQNLIVQEAICIVLRVIYEHKLSYFSSQVHSFLSKKSRHTAIQEIKEF